MKKQLYLFIALALCCSSLSAQNTFYSLFSYNNEIPQIRLNDQAYDLQKTIFPKMYKNRSLTADIRWVQENDSVLSLFWEIKGDTVLHILSELSGIEWVEKEFDLYLLRYYSQIGSASPLVLPLGGINNGSFIESAPDVQKQKLLLIYYLAKRMLLQADRPGDDKLSISYHPLMRKTPYRFDNLAMLLAVTTSYSILGVDTTYDITQSTFWKNKFPGRKIFEEYFERNWILTPEKTLSDYLASEPTRSRLVSLTRTPRVKQTDKSLEYRTFVEDLPLKGRFGFAVKLNDAGHTAVTEIDMYRLAYACGLRTDDVIRRIDGKLVRNHKQIIEYLLDKLDDGGSVVGINRMGQAMEIIIQPLEIDYLQDEYYLDEYNQDDTMYFDTLIPETDN